VTLLDIPSKSMLDIDRPKTIMNSFPTGVGVF
jgi:hypothetical protein